MLVSVCVSVMICVLETVVLLLLQWRTPSSLDTSIPLAQFATGQSQRSMLNTTTILLSFFGRLVVEITL